MNDTMQAEAARPGLWALFGVFLKVGALSFGGPYAILSYIEKETVERRRWLTTEDFARGVGIGHLTPGPIAFSSAVYAGRRLRGLGGAFVAAIGLLLPSFLIAVVYAIVYSYVADLPAVKPVLMGFNAAVIGLLAGIVVKMAKKGIGRSWKKASIAAGAFVLMLLRMNPALVVLAGALVAALVLGPNTPDDAGGSS